MNRYLTYKEIKKLKDNPDAYWWKPTKQLFVEDQVDNPHYHKAFIAVNCPMKMRIQMTEEVWQESQEEYWGTIEVS